MVLQIAVSIRKGSIYCETMIFRENMSYLKGLDLFITDGPRNSM